MNNFNAILRKLLSPAYIGSEILDVHHQIDEAIKNNPKQAFKPYWVNTARGMKPLASIDLVAERAFEASLLHDFPNHVRVIGEESLDESVLRGEKKLCVLVDMIDGTDLLERGFSNWCSAVVIFDPAKDPPKILGAFVGIRNEYLYFANDKGAFRTPLRRQKVGNQPEPLRMLNTKSLRDASVCMYAQKPSRLLSLLSLATKPLLMSWLASVVKSDAALKQKLNRTPQDVESRFRFYDLAGNPMMVRMAEGAIDVVFELGGQSPHDVVPGAYIAHKAGAVLGYTDGERISELKMAEALLEPGKNTLSYVLAANEKIYSEFIGLMDPADDKVARTSAGA